MNTHLMKNKYIPYDKNLAADKKTIKQLKDELVQFEAGLAKVKENPAYYDVACSFYVNHIAFLKMKIGERIGRKHGTR